MRPPIAGAPLTPTELATIPPDKFMSAVAETLRTPALDPASGAPLHPWSSRPVWPCSVQRCGHFMCASCIRAIPLVCLINASDPRRFRCPVHVCSCCSKGADGSVPLLQSLLTPHAYHVRCLPSPASSLFPVRLSRRFIIPAAHPRCTELAALARRRIRVHNSGHKVAGELGDKEILKGQAGSGKVVKKGLIGTVHPMCGKDADQAPRVVKKRARIKRGPGDAGKPEDGPASVGGAKKRIRLKTGAPPAKRAEDA